MPRSLYPLLLVAIGGGFAIAFAVICIPAVLTTGDIPGAFAAGFVNPFATGYSLDVFSCWAVLAVWVIYERKTLGIRHGWITLVLGVVPGVATGFAAYLLLRDRQRPSTQTHE
ncbi:MAG: DUF2834 domain-containing protein [Myxococcota bacterium]